jgi:hypothetical protein
MIIKQMKVNKNNGRSWLINTLFDILKAVDLLITTIISRPCSYVWPVITYQIAAYYIITRTTRPPTHYLVTSSSTTSRSLEDLIRQILFF